jgi:hypothetical protein
MYMFQAVRFNKLLSKAIIQNYLAESLHFPISKSLLKF